MKNGLQTPELSFNKVLIRSACHNLNGSCMKCTEISAVGEWNVAFGDKFDSSVLVLWWYESKSSNADRDFEIIYSNSPFAPEESRVSSMGKWHAQNHMGQQITWWMSFCSACSSTLPHLPSHLLLSHFVELQSTLA